MKMRKDLLGIVLGFLATGLIATGVDSQAYHALNQEHDSQVKKINTVLNSEFITSADKQALTKELKFTTASEKNDTRSKMKQKAATEKKVLARVQGRTDGTEAKFAQSAYYQLRTDLSELSKKGEEKFILASDNEKIAGFEGELADLADAKRVKPVRHLTSEVADFSKEMADNQTALMDQVAQMKKLNASGAELAKKKYVSDADKKELAADQKENTQFFEDADDRDAVATRKTSSETLIKELSTKQADTEQDFKANEVASKQLVQSTTDLIAKGNLTAEEKTKLSATNTLLASALAFKNYKPGDLATTYKTLKTDYDTTHASSDKRNAEAAAKKAAEAKAAAEKQAAEQKAAEARAAQAAASQSQASASNNSSPGAATVSGGWTTAPAGWVYLKVESGKTYRSVKNPENYREISEAEAGNYSPGHSNGYARN